MNANRYIIHTEIILNKTSKNKADALTRALYKCYRPYILHSDNGLEFWGSDFQDVLISHQIHFTTNIPYLPQENGKIERWWKTFDQSLLDLNNLEGFVDEYKNIWYHSALKDRFGKNTTPADARSYLESWVNQNQLYYIYTQ